MSEENNKPALRLEMAWQLGFLQGAVRAFLGGYGSKEDLVKNMALVDEWQQEADKVWWEKFNATKERSLLAEKSAHLIGKIDASNQATNEWLATGGTGSADGA